MFVTAHVQSDNERVRAPRLSRPEVQGHIRRGIIAETISVKRSAEAINKPLADEQVEAVRRDRGDNSIRVLITRPESWIQREDQSSVAIVCMAQRIPDLRWSPDMGDHVTG